jgi:hypothetical protein
MIQKSVRAAPDTSYQIDFMDFDGRCPNQSRAHAPFVVVTGAAGHAAFQHAVPGSLKFLAMTATRLLPDGRPAGGASELSDTFEVAPFSCDPICRPDANLSIEAIDVPATVAQGDTVTLRFRITNHGWFSAADVIAQQNGSLAGGTVAPLDLNHEPDGQCDADGCSVEGLGVGESVIVRQEVRVTGAPGSHLTETLHVSAALPGDSMAANDNAAINIPIVAPASVPALSTGALVLLGAAIVLAGWRIR